MIFIIKKIINNNPLSWDDEADKTAELSKIQPVIGYVNFQSHELAAP